MPKKKNDPTVENTVMPDGVAQPTPNNSADGEAAATSPRKKSTAKLPVDEPQSVASDGEGYDETETEVEISEFVKRMDLEVVEAGTNEKLNFKTFNISRPGLQLAGYYKHFSAERVQVIGEMEMTYLHEMTHNARKTACETLMSHDIPCLIIASKMPPCPELISAVKRYNRVMLRSKLRTTMLVNKLSLYLNELLAPSKTVHGVLMDLYGVGVLMIGESGIGKSETALSLVERGHRLVADDAVTIKRIGDRLDGTCPDVIRYLMELRGIGIIDIKAMYGAGAVQLVKTIDMVVKLEAWNDTAQYNRLGTPDETYTILGVDKPLHVIPVKPGRNLAVILEAAARTHRLNDLGFSALDELNERLRKNTKK